LAVPDKKKTPLWILGLLKESHIYNSIEEIVTKIEEINSGTQTLNSKKWKLLNQELR
jgi:hypothetical protein